MTRVTIDNYEWTSLMVPEERTKKETDADKKMVKDYLTKLENEPSIELDAVKVEELTVDDSLIESQETEFERLANNDLFNYFQSEKEEIDAQVLFPKMEMVLHGCVCYLTFGSNLPADKKENRHFRICFDFNRHDVGYAYAGWSAECGFFCCIFAGCVCNYGYRNSGIR